MDAGKIIRLVAVIVAVVAGVVTIPQSALIIAVLGLVAGYFIADDRVPGKSANLRRPWPTASISSSPGGHA